MRVFEFTWKEIAPHLPAKVFICLAADLAAALVILTQHSRRPVDLFYQIDPSGQMVSPTDEGRDHHFQWASRPLLEGEVIFSNL